ncbi:hypothetical protein SDC9_33820 [bioreactor metagenome]|uniref:Uncharacterized protein n=1 Tax=bioreactor metagenome TaxID=1076179 RepID=A0A644V900_9ZZZZ
MAEIIAVCTSEKKGMRKKLGPGLPGEGTWTGGRPCWPAASSANIKVDH